jgi:hypothetical protein
MRFQNAALGLSVVVGGKAALDLGWKDDTDLTSFVTVRSPSDVTDRRH